MGSTRRSPCCKRSPATDPEAEAAILSLTYAKGLAKPGPDGRLTWTIEFEGGEVTVNGSPLPTGK